ncbi:MAG: VPGUxxT family thioredoxin-like (seleno)protein, type 2, partial [Thermodesulfobacteriota bacterium]
MNKILLKIPVCAIVLLFYVFISSGNTKENTNNTIDKSSHSTLAELGEAKDSPVELGEVEWIRNFDEATTKAKKLNKPLLVLFQEVPGCSTSSGYGKNVLSHPLIVEAIETLFVPAAIYNNNKGEDERVLKSFGEPSWNNPVVRIMTPERQELVSRLSGDYTKAGLVRAMITALESNNKTVPPYLSLLAQELNVKSGSRERAVFAMHCFWIGEGKLANIKGVISTKPGFMGGYEVVELEFNPKIISFEDLVKKGKSNNVASHIFTVLKRMKPFDVHLHYFDRHRLSAEVERELGVTFHDSVESMVKVCDVVTINCPLHPETEHLFDEDMINKMKRGTYLVNTARGKICDRNAIAKALETGQLAGYAGDVWFPQPAPKDHPWRTMPNHGMTPHTSGT